VGERETGLRDAITGRERPLSMLQEPTPLQEVLEQICKTTKPAKNDRL